MNVAAASTKKTRSISNLFYWMRQGENDYVIAQVNTFTNQVFLPNKRKGHLLSNGGVLVGKRIVGSIDLTQRILPPNH